MTTKKLVGQNIRNFRLQKGWTMEKLAVRSKINYDFLGHVERGESSINVDNLEKIALALKIELWKLVYPNAHKEFPLNTK